MKRFASKLLSGDARLLYYMNHRVRCTVLDWLMPLMTHLGGAVFTVTFTLALVLIGSEGVRKLGWEVATSLTLSHLIVHVLKRRVNRPRPHTVMEQIERFNVPICDYSFPSGHATAAFAVANILAMAFPVYAAILIGLAAGVAISRMYLGVHYPSDVLVGLVIATVSSVIVHRCFAMLF